MPLMSGVDQATEQITAFQCIGCGRIEAPQPCIGICEDRKVQFVYATQHEEALKRLELAEERIRALERFVRHFASTTPRAGEWERSYRTLQAQARRALAASRGTVQDNR
jgi:hypothetical protein